MPLVYRIETKTGKGICSATGSPLCDMYYKACGDETEHCSFCPVATRNARKRGVLDNPSMHFAFPSMWALKNWFPQSKGRKIMEQNGAIGTVYSVPKLEIASDYQCVFDKSKAIKVREFAL